MGQQEQQQRQQIIFGDIFDGEDEASDVAGRSTTVADRISNRRRFLNEESSGQRKYLAFSLNYSSNCDYNNR